MAPIQTTLKDAINHIKTWISNKEFEKAKQGIDEILEFDPVNAEAKLLREELAKTQAPTPALTSTAIPSPTSAPAQTTTFFPTRTHRKISLIGIISAIAVLTISGGIGFYASKYLAAPQTEQTTERTLEEPQDSALKGSVITAESAAENTTNVAPESAVESTTKPAVEPTTEPAPEPAPTESTAQFTLEDSLIFLFKAFGTELSPAEIKTRTSPQRIKVKRR